MTTALLSGILQFISENFTSLSIGAGALILFIAFCIGVIKGFYRTSRRWIKFLAVLALFFFGYKKFAGKIPLGKIPYISTLGADIQGAIVSFAVFLAATVAVNIVFGIIDAIVKASAIKKLESGVALSEKGKDTANWKPGFFSRLSGGVACMLNVGVFIAFFLSLAYFVCSLVPALRENHLSFLYSFSLTDTLLSYLKTYALDSLAILFILSVSYCGYRAGAMNGIRSVIMTFGLLAAVGFGFYLPFSPWVGTKAFLAPLNVVTGWFEKLFAKLPEGIVSKAPLFSKLATGLCLTLIFILLLVIINAVLKALARSMRRAAVIRVIDGSLCFIVTFALAVAVVVAVAAVMFSLDYLNVFQGKFTFSSLFTQDAPLNSALKTLFDACLTPYLEQAKAAMSAVGA
ncbi:MAG: hypothetical protein ACI4SH_08485 [Candidatus Scatosoma sp.]